MSCIVIFKCIWLTTYNQQRVTDSFLNLYHKRGSHVSLTSASCLSQVLVSVTAKHFSRIFVTKTVEHTLPIFFFFTATKLQALDLLEHYVSPLRILIHSTLWAWSGVCSPAGTTAGFFCAAPAAELKPQWWTTCLPQDSGSLNFTSHLFAALMNIA